MDDTYTHTAALLLCAKCNGRIDPESFEYAERQGGPLYCKSCLSGAMSTVTDVTINWRCWTLFMMINLLWFLTIIIITNVSSSIREVVTLASLALLLYAGSLLWLHNTLNRA